MVKCRPGILLSNLETNIKPKFEILQSIRCSGSLVGSDDEVGNLVRISGWFLSTNLVKTMVPNVEFLVGCGIPLEQIVRFMYTYPRFILKDPEMIRRSVEKADKMGVRRGLKIFFHAVRVVSSMNNKTWEKKLQAFRDLGFSEEDILRVFRQAPPVFSISPMKMKRIEKVVLATGKYTLSTGRDDCWKWKYSTNGIYVVKKAYDLRMERRGDAREVEQETSLFKKLWKSWAVRKAVVTSWKLLKGKMATTDNLGRRGITLNNEEKKCQFCLEEEESIRHLFFECKVSSSIWESILRWLGVSMVLHIDPKIHFLHFGECLGSGTKATVARTIWIGTVWSLWNTRNDIVFNKATFNADRESSKIKISVWNWISALDQRLLDLNLRNWLGDPTKCLEIM
ncbi:hypothetical protein ACS0TY_013441 [Phlomoides rotata]